MVPSARRLEVEIVGDASSLHRALNQSSTSSSKFGSVLGKLRGAALGAGAAIAGGLAVGLEESIRKALKAETVNARLGVAFKNAGMNAKNYSGQIDKLDASSRRLGFTDEATKTALGSLITATGSYAKAAKLVGVAQDIARFKGVRLEDATKMLTMAMAGSQRAAKQLGITVPAVTTAYDKLKNSNVDLTTASGKALAAQAKLHDKMATSQAVIDAVTAKVHGQAKAYSDTAAGAMEQFRAQLDHIEVAIGEKLLPVMTKAIEWITAHWPQITAVVVASWKTIEPTLSALMQLVVQVVSTIKQHWSSIAPIVRAVAEVVKTQLAILGSVIKLFTALLRGDWSGAWGSLKGIVNAALNAVKAELNLFKTVVFSLASGIGNAMLHGIMSGLSALGGMIKKLVRDAINSVIDTFNSVAGVFKYPTGVHWSSWHGVPTGTPHITWGQMFPHVPHLAKGGPLMAGQAAVVGEKGPELFVPSMGGTVIPNGAGSPIIVNLVLDGKIAAKALIDPMRGEAQIFKQRTGRAAFA